MATQTITITNGIFNGTLTYEDSTPIPPPTNTALKDTETQNTVGKSEAFPLGVPHSYSWYTGKSGQLGSRPPANFTSMTQWGQLYPEEGKPIVAGKVQITKMETWLRNTSGVWTKAQDQMTQKVTGAYYVSDFSGNANIKWNARVLSDGHTIEIDSPPDNHNIHFWPEPRASYPANTCDGVWTRCDIKLSAANMNFVINVGGDWWLSPTAPFVQNPDGSMPNNPGIGMGNWIKLTTEWRTSYFTSLALDDLKANLPPPLK